MLEHKIKNYGLVFEETAEEDYVVGGLKSAPQEVLVENGDWRPYLPAGEEQRKGEIETNACVSFALLNALEILVKRKFNAEINKSERYTAIVSDTTSAGNSPKKVAQSFRDYGVIDDYFLPFNAGISYDVFFSPKPMTKQYLDIGEEWKSKWNFRYEYIFNQVGGRINDKQKLLMENLKHSPVPISVLAWIYDEQKKLYTKPAGTPDNHEVVLVAYEEGKKWFIFDSYPESEGDFIKELDWDYDFTTAQKIWLEKQTTPEQIGVFMKILQFLANILKLDLEILKIKQTPPSTPLETQNPTSTTPPQPPLEIPITPKYEWGTPEKARHSVRVICDEEGLNVADKNLICAVINCESGFKIDAIHKNKDKSGNVLSIDYGIIQANSNYYIGNGKPIVSIDEALNNPEKCVRVIISQFKKGRLKDWVCYSSGKYLNYIV